MKDIKFSIKNIDPCYGKIEVKIKNGVLSICGKVWKLGYCDQSINSFDRKFKNHDLGQRICKVWKRWHLNDVNAGSPIQEEWIRNNYQPYNSYDEACKLLTKAGLNPDRDFLGKDGKPYLYGREWIKEDLPQDVYDEVLSWRDVKDCLIYNEWD